MRFEINLASQPYRNAQRFMARWGIAVGVAVVVVLGLAYAATVELISWHMTHSQIQGLQRQIAECDRQKAAVAAVLGRPENRETRNRSEFLNFLIARKAFCWTEVFADLEQIMPPPLRLAQMSPKVNEDGQLELDLTVLGPERAPAIELVRRLEQSPHFTRAQILSEATSQKTQGPMETVEYQISAIYIPAFARTPQQNATAAGAQGSGSPATGLQAAAGSPDARVRPAEVVHGRP